MTNVHALQPVRKKEYPGSFLATAFEDQILAKIEINVDDVRDFFLDRLGIKKREHIDSPVTGASEKLCFELVHEEIPCTTIPSHPLNETKYDVHEPNLAHFLSSPNEHPVWLVASSAHFPH